MNKIIFATKNQGKLREVRDLFVSLGIEVIGLDEFPEVPDVIEDLPDFEGNAEKKAREMFEHLQLPVIADDSGLAVEQLNGAPGVHSARYSDPGATPARNNEKLLAELQNFDQPHAAMFVSCLVFFDGKSIIRSRGELHGNIIHTARGQKGFGYDPLFVPTGADRTLAEMDMAEKNSISHRGRAFRSLIEQLQGYLNQ